MKVKKNDAEIHIKLPIELKKTAEKILAVKEKTISDFVREKLTELL